MKQPAKKSLQAYLDKFSRAIDLSAWSLDQSWQHVLILPVCAESYESMDEVFQHLSEPSVLVILVLNRPEKHPRTDAWSAQNSSFKQALVSHYKHAQPISTDHCLLTAGALPDVLLLDFNQLPFNHNEGVGLARRIAADTACALIGLGCIKVPWIFSTDADVTLPSDYFNVIDVYPDAAALSLGFKHHSNNKTMAAHQQKYDFKLKYYQLGVKFIGAAYDYIPLGSTLVINAIAYVKVRGFPCKSGGEDFYILNKLAKVGDIYQPKKPIVNINIRYSDRVPFGTGPALKKLSEAESKPKYYHPRVFHVIKNWRKALIDYFISGSIPVNDFGLNEYWDINSLFLKVRKQYNTLQHWLKFIDDWFDAFKILKSVHFLELTYQGVKRSELEKMGEYLEIVTNKANK